MEKTKEISTNAWEESKKVFLNEEEKVEKKMEENKDKNKDEQFKK